MSVNMEVNLYSPLALAYVGDSVYELFIRTYLLEGGNKSTNNLHKEAKKYVNASAQSEIVGLLQEYLTNKELEIYKRGRNSKSYTKAKNMSVLDYRRATGFEALIGYLYIDKQTDRLKQIIDIIINTYKKEF